MRGTTIKLLWSPHGIVCPLSVALRVALGAFTWPGKRGSTIRRPSPHSTPERQSLCESHRQRRWLPRWNYVEYACWRCSCSSLKWIEPRHRLQVTSCHPRTTRERRRLRVRRWPQAVCSRSVSHRWIGCSIEDLHRCCQGRTGAVIAQTARGTVVYLRSADNAASPPSVMLFHPSMLQRPSVPTVSILETVSQ